MLKSYPPYLRFLSQSLLPAAALGVFFLAPPGRAPRSVRAAGAGISRCAAAPDGPTRREAHRHAEVS